MSAYKIAYFVVKIIILVLASLFIFVAAGISMTTKEELRQYIAANFGKYFFYRFLFCFCITIIFFLISLLANYLFRLFHGFNKKQMIRITFGELGYYVLFSVISILLFIYHAYQ